MGVERDYTELFNILIENRNTLSEKKGLRESDWINTVDGRQQGGELTN